MKIEVIMIDDIEWANIIDRFCCAGMQKLYDFDYSTPLQFNTNKFILEFQSGVLSGVQCNYCPCCGAKVEVVIVPPKSDK